MRASPLFVLSLLLTASLVPGLTACQNGAPSRVEASADSTAGTVGFELAGPGGAALVVPVYLNGQGPHSFVLDTGATLTCVSEDLADSLGLPARTGSFGFGTSVEGTGTLRLVGVDSLRVGGTKAFDLAACTLDLDHLEQAGLPVDGLLGLNVLKAFRVTLDFGTRTLHLQER